jgi:hypothetical protein
MPTQIASLSSKTLTERIRDFVKTLPDGEGWSTSEMTEKFNASFSIIKINATRLGIKRDGKWFFVNPKTRAKYAQKN